MLDEVCSSGQTGHGQERRHFCFGQGTEIGPASDIAYFTNGCVISARRLGLASDRFRRRHRGMEMKCARSSQLSEA
jgi:hypothetical protein